MGLRKELFYFTFIKFDTDFFFYMNHLIEMRFQISVELWKTTYFQNCQTLWVVWISQLVSLKEAQNNYGLIAYLAWILCSP